MDNRQRQDLDNYITGHHGEDQFKGEEPDDDLCPDDLEDMSAHETFCFSNSLSVYRYDPTEDGPECEVIKAIRSTHAQNQLDDEEIEHVWRAIDAEQERWEAEERQKDLFRTWEERGTL